MYLYDEGEVHHVVDVVQSTTSRPVKQQVVKQFIKMVNADDLINADQENVNDLINAELHQCTKAASRTILKCLELLASSMQLVLYSTRTSSSYPNLHRRPTRLISPYSDHMIMMADTDSH